MATTGVKCFLGGLSYGSSEDSLRNYFSRFKRGERRRAPRFLFSRLS